MKKFYYFTFLLLISIKAFNQTPNSEPVIPTQALLDNRQVIWFEPFNYSTGALPPGWQLVEGSNNWYVSFNSNAGGNPPELRFDRNPIHTGFSRILSTPINLQGHKYFRLSWLLNIFGASSQGTAIVGIDVTFDGGDTYQTAWERVVNQSIQPQEKEFYLEAPEGANTMHLSLRYNGYSANLLLFSTDNFKLETVATKDLKASSIIGEASPTTGIEYIYTLGVQNTGSLMQSNYSVKLMKEGGIELASVAGVPIEFSETAYFEIPWTPNPGDLGPTYIYGLVELEGDQVPGNNQTLPFNIVVQSDAIQAVSIGNGTINHILPIDLFYKHSMSQTIYYQHEIGLTGGALLGIRYANDFNEPVTGIPLKIWVGETLQSSLADGWVSPASMEMVFDGLVDFPTGQSNVFINFDNPFIYSGNNLVIYFVKNNNAHGSSKTFFSDSEPGSSRSRRAHGMGDPFDPYNPQNPSASQDLYPNITMFFSTEGMGALAGNIFDDKDPVPGVQVEILGTSLAELTDSNGDYSFPYVLPDIYNVRYSKFGYFPVIIEGVVIEDGQTTTQNLEMFEIPQHTFSGVVHGNDDLPIEGALVTLQGYENYSFTTNSQGEFFIEGVYAGNYHLKIEAEGYKYHEVESLSIQNDLDIGTLVLIEIIEIPKNLSVQLMGLEDGEALLSWPDAIEREFRWDDGIAVGQIGFNQGSLNGVIGSVHRHEATIHEIVWYLTDVGVQHQNVTVWIFGLDETGHPDNQTILYQANNVPTVHENWVKHTLSTPVHAPNGFLIGLSSQGFLSLGRDFGANPQWPFMPNTHFTTANINTNPFIALEDNTDYSSNFMIRAIGMDYGFIDSKQLEATYPVNEHLSSDLHISALEYNIDTGSSGYSKAFLGYDVFLNEIPVASLITEQQYLFTDLEEGLYSAGVRSVYTSGSSEIVTIAFEMLFGVPVTVSVQTNSGDSPAGALVTLTNIVDGQFVYSQVAQENGDAIFTGVRKGTYTLTVSLGEFEEYIADNLDIQEEVGYDVMLIEVIAVPFGLHVDYLGDGNALFSWNEIIADELFEGFEGPFPPAGWNTLNPDGGSGWIQISSGVSPLPGWQDGEATPAPDGGSRMAYTSWQQGGADHNDQWLISPQLIAKEEFDFSFYLRYWPSAFNDNVDIRISTAGDEDVIHFNIIVDQLQFSSSSNTNWNYYHYKITDFISPGTPFYLAFREHVSDNSTQGAAIMLDNVYYGPVEDRITLSSMECDNRTFEGRRDYNFETTPKTEKVFLGYNVFLNGNEVAAGIQDRLYQFSGLPWGEHVAGVQSVYSSGVSEIVTVSFFADDNPPEKFPVTFVVIDEEQIYSALKIKGQMTEPQWIAIPLTENPLHTWEATLQVAPGTYQWGIIEDDGTENGQWLLPDGQNLEFTLDEYGNTEGTIQYVLQPVSVAIHSDSEILLFPNPASYKVVLQSKYSLEHISIADSYGRIVYSNHSNSKEYFLDVSGFSNGVYLVRVVSSEGVFLKKLQILK